MTRELTVRTKLRTRSAGAALLTLTLTLTAACSNNETSSGGGGGGGGEPIKIASIISLTSTNAGVGIPERQGIELAIEEINKAGGVCEDRPLDVTIEDDASNPETGAAKADKLVNGDGAVALIGGSLTSVTDAMAARTGGGTLPQIAFTGLGPPIELEYENLYHMLPSQALNARAMLEYARSIGAKRIGALHDSGFGKVVTGNVLTLAGEYGVEVVANEEDEVGATNVTSQAAKVNAAKPDAVFVISSNPTYYRNAREAGITIPIIATVGIAAYESVKAMGAAADNIIIPEFLVAEDALPEQQDFVAKFRAKYNSPPKNFEAAGYDAVKLLAAALESTKCDTSPKALGQALRKPYDGVLASYDFSAKDKTGIDLSDFVYSKLVKGQFTRLDFKPKA